MQHLTYHLYLRCCEKVSLRKEAADNDSTRILNDILAEEAWLSKVGMFFNTGLDSGYVRGFTINFILP